MDDDHPQNGSRNIFKTKTKSFFHFWPEKWQLEQSFPEKEREKMKEFRKMNRQYFYSLTLFFSQVDFSLQKLFYFFFEFKNFKISFFFLFFFLFRDFSVVPYNKKYNIDHVQKINNVQYYVLIVIVVNIVVWKNVLLLVCHVMVSFKFEKFWKKNQKIVSIHTR